MEIKTAWTTAENSIQMPDGRGNTFWIQNYALECLKRYPGVGDDEDKYYLMMAPDDIADAFGKNYRAFQGGDIRPLVGAMNALIPKYGIYSGWWITSTSVGGLGIAHAARQINKDGLSTHWPTRFGSFDFSTLAPGQSVISASVPSQEAPADSPTPARWPKPAAGAVSNVGPNADGTWVGAIVDGVWYKDMDGDPTVPFTEVTDPRGKFLLIVVPMMGNMAHRTYMKIG